MSHVPQAQVAPGLRRLRAQPGARFQAPSPASGGPQVPTGCWLACTHAHTHTHAHACTHACTFCSGREEEVEAGPCAWLSVPQPSDQADQADRADQAVRTIRGVMGLQLSFWLWEVSESEVVSRAADSALGFRERA